MNNHTESSIKIYFSKDYAQFRMIRGNRELNESKIKRIKRDIAHGIDVLSYCPILVRPTGGGILEIVDGQHRFWVSKTLKKPIHYIIVNNIDLMGIAKINSNTEKWKAADFINCYAQQGNEHYIQLRDFMEKHSLPKTTAQMLLGMGLALKETYFGRDEFENGSFQVHKVDEAEYVIETCKKFSACAQWKDRGFIIAIAKILSAGKCDIEELLEKFNKNPDALTKQLNAKEYLVNLEVIYNKNAQKRRVIY